MFLRGLRIENFRAIRKTTISFNDGTVLMGENDCGISSVLDALELVLGFYDKNEVFPPYLFHYPNGADQPAGPIRIQLRFGERRPGEWDGQEYEPYLFLLPKKNKRLREIWYETVINPGESPESAAHYRLRAPGNKSKTSDPELIGRFRRMNPVIRVSAGMLTGHGAFQGRENENGPTHKVSTEVRELMSRIRRAVDSRLYGLSTDLKADLEDGYAAAHRLIELNEFKLGKWESGLTRSVGEIIGWSPGTTSAPAPGPLHSPHSTQERLGTLLLIAALIRARPGGMAPDADPLWIIEEPEAHLHPITLTSVAIFVSMIQRQKIVTTYSGELLAAVSLGQVRRLVRYNGELFEQRVRKTALSRQELRRFQYHLRSRFAIASFARLWLLVEGESEYWLLPQIARLMGYEFALEGIACVVFAQCGLDPPLKVSRELGIEWHLLADGDAAGKNYVQTAQIYLGSDPPGERLTLLRQKDIERCFWDHGYDDLYKRISGLSESKLQKLSPGRIIQAAVRRRSKPFLALSIVEAMAVEGSPGIPPVLQQLVETCVGMAREAPVRIARK
jgi:putative ATP-dependent endonuclease of OLD family